jgi:hypothetical protein
MFENLKIALETIRSNEYKITQTTKQGELVETVQQTQRNGIKTLLREALYMDILSEFPKTDEGGVVVAYATADGIVLEIPNESIADKIANVSGSGAISAVLDFSISALNYNASDLADEYEEKLAKKRADEEAKATAKAKKMALDKAAREARAKKKGEGI